MKCTSRGSVSAIVVLFSAFYCGPLDAADLAVAIPPGSNIVAHITTDHPRLLAKSRDFAELRQKINAADPWREWHKQLLSRGEQILAEPPSKYEIPDGLRLLSTSRRVLQRIYTLGLLHQLHPNPAYVERAWRELDAAAQFPDWNPRHFLDTAEMTHAFAIGYDWLYQDWSAEQREILRHAIESKGLELARAGYRGDRALGWMRAKHNWNQVCNGGLSMGALAIAHVNPELAGDVLHGALKSLQLPMREFAPDGAWSEGPGYWNYATAYNVAVLAALHSAAGTDFGLSQIPGFAEAGMFPLYLTGPLGRTFNYADGGDGTIRAPQMFWLSAKFNRPVYAWYAQHVATPAPQDLLWARAGGAGPRDAALPLDKYFRNAEVVTLRSEWENPQALFVGFKGGDNRANHSNLDLGTFVLDALGVRWAVDLGADNYNLPGYFGKERWTYYRMRAEGHNTLVINPSPAPDQSPSAAAPIERFQSHPDRAFAIADLTAAYAPAVRSVRRGIALLGRKQVLIQDEIELAAPGDIHWFLHSPEEITVASDGTAILRRESKRLWARILEPSGAQFRLLPAGPLPNSAHPAKQAANESIRKLAVHLEGTQRVTLAVQLVPLADLNQTPPGPEPVRPLAEW